MRHAWTPKFQLSEPTVHSLYCGYIIKHISNIQKQIFAFMTTFSRCHQNLKHDKQSLKSYEKQKG